MTTAAMLRADTRKQLDELGEALVYRSHATGAALERTLRAILDWSALAVDGDGPGGRLRGGSAADVGELVVHRDDLAVVVTRKDTVRAAGPDGVVRDWPVVRVIDVDPGAWTLAVGR